MNKAIEKFVLDLNLAFGNRMSKDQRHVYVSAIASWERDRGDDHSALESTDFAAALVTIQREEDSERAPALARIFAHLQRAQRERFKAPPRPPLPTDADKARLLAVPEGNYRAQCRAIFRTNFVLAGGDPSAVDDWFEMIDRGLQPSSSARYKPAKPVGRVADYDDSPRALLLSEITARSRTAPNLSVITANDDYSDL